MQPDSEDDAWRSIVENYGPRAELDPDEPGALEALPGRAFDGTDDEDEFDDAQDQQDEEEERYVPPPPPPLPRVSPDRFLAWAGVFGSPTILLLALLVGIPIAPWLGYLLVAAFVGGFLYLVVRMPRGPRDPGDDGARL